MVVRRPRGERHVVLSAAALVVASACGVEDRVITTGGSGGNTDLGNAVARFARAHCFRLQACHPTYLTVAYGTYDRCVERTALMNDWIAELPGVLWDADFLLDCATAWDDLPCDEILSPFPVAECKQLGSRPIGEQCNSGEQCATGFCKQTGYECGLCASQPSQGSACASDADCGEAQWCMPDKTCHTPSDINDPCSTNLRCRADLQCSGGVCVASPSAVGASCNAPAGLYCDFLSKGLYCTSAMTCAAATAKAPNESCAEGGSYCSSNASCTNGTCVPSPADKGGACDHDNGPYCEWPARCVAGSCQLPTAAGRCAR
jgi:hypothetical protein